MFLKKITKLRNYVKKHRGPNFFKGKEKNIMPGKKNGNGEGSVRRRANGTYQGRVTDKTGKQRSFTRNTRAEAVRYKNELLQQINADTYVPPIDGNFSAWLDSWLETYVKISREASTYANYVYCVNANIKPVLGAYKLQDIRQQHVQAFVNALHDKGKASSTVKKNYAVLHAALDQAHALNMIQRIPCEHTQLPKASQKEVKAFTLDEQARFVEALPDTAEGRALLFMLGSGVRVGELLALQWDDIGEQGIHIRRTIKERMKAGGQGVELYVGSPKSAKSDRHIPLNEPLKRLLGRHRIAQNERRLECGGVWTDNNLVFPNSLGGYNDDRNLSHRVLSPALKKAGIAHCGTHTLRHTFATRAIENGVDVRTLSELLGHADVATTLRLYVHSTQASKDNAMDKMGGFLTAKMSV